jgi:hypothetical protein
VLAANTSMIQKWHARRSGESPYFLYAASNAGSFVALCAYPFAVEPAVGLRAQLKLWGAGYLIFLALMLSALSLAWRSGPEVEIAPPGPPMTRRLRWMARAAIPSSLLLAVSLGITTDVAAIPLLWVVPLALYLATFVLAFWPRLRFPRRALVAIGALLVVTSLAWPDLGRHALSLKLGVPLGILFIGGWICHGDLARDRPDPSHLTDYYLWISIGGFAGGVFGNLLAPRLFHSVAEYPLSLALLTIAFSIGDDQGTQLWSALRRPRAWSGYALVIVPFLVWVVLALRLQHVPDWFDYIPLTLVGIAMVMWQRPGQFALACACAALINVFGVVSGVRTVEARRSFFGVVRVREVEGVRALVHGTTRHGGQRVDPFDPQPVLYYAPMSPLARAVSLEPDGAELAVVGLGCGSVAWYTKPHQKMRYFEIDPIIEPMARRWFTFLRDAPAPVEVRLGDARLRLHDLPDHSQDMVFVDAFSSDAIPVHLLTSEAIQLYMQKLKPGGLVILHLSNRYLDLAQVPRAIAHHLGLAAAHIDYEPDRDFPNAQVEAVALAAEQSTLQKLYDRGWNEMEAGDEVLWTDDRSSLLPLLTD